MDTLTFIIIALVFFFITLYTDHLKGASRSVKEIKVLTILCVVSLYAAIASFIVACWLSIPVVAVGG